MAIENCIGKIRIHPNWVLNTDPDTVSTFFAEFYPLSIDSIPGDDSGALMYTGVCVHFERLEPGADIPEYVGIITMGEHFNWIEFERVETKTTG